MYSINTMEKVSDKVPNEIPDKFIIKPILACTGTCTNCTNKECFNI